MTNDELIALVQQAIEQVRATGTTYEAEQIQKGLERAKDQLERPNPAREILGQLCVASRQGKHMDRYQDSDVIQLWILADRVLALPCMPGDRRADVDVVFDEDAKDELGLVSVGTKQVIPRAGDTIRIFRRRA